MIYCQERKKVNKIKINFNVFSPGQIMGFLMMYFITIKEENTVIQNGLLKISQLLALS